MSEAFSQGDELKNVHVLVTRPHGQIDNLAQLIEQAGGTAILFPTIAIAAPHEAQTLLTIVDRLDQFDIAIFISPNAVIKTLDLLRSRGRDLPPTLVVACIGSGSARELNRYGARIDIVPASQFDSEALLAMPALQQVSGRKIVIFRGKGGRELLGDTLMERGAQIEYAECYRRTRPEADIAPLLQVWKHGGIDIVCVTSTDGMRNLFDMLGKTGQPWLIRTPIVTVSKRVATMCSELGFKNIPQVAASACDADILSAIKTWRATQNSL